MAPKTKLSAYAPTAKELEEARQVLAGADNRNKRARMAAMTHWLKTNPDEAVF